MIVTIGARDIFAVRAFARAEARDSDEKNRYTKTENALRWVWCSVTVEVSIGKSPVHHLTRFVKGGTMGAAVLSQK